MLAVLLLVPQALLAGWLIALRLGSFSTGVPVCDYVVFYVGGHLANQGRLAWAYDPAIYQSNLESTVGDLNRMFWLYPPPMAVVAQPFAALSYGWGCAAWLVFGISTWIYAAYRLFGRRGVAWMLVFPGTVIAFHYAQAVLWLAAVLSEALRLVEERPIVGGALVGILALKPHWLILVLFGLVVARRAQAVVAALAMGAALGLGSVALHGWAPWHAFFAHAGAGAAWLRCLDAVEGVSPYASAPLFLAPAFQAGCTAAAFGVTAWVFARPYAHDARVAVLPFALSLASLYLHFYDLIVLGISALVVARRLDARGEPLLPFVALSGAVLWGCRVVGALFEVQLYPIAGLIGLFGVVWLARDWVDAPPVSAS